MVAGLSGVTRIAAGYAFTLALASHVRRKVDVGASVDDLDQSRRAARQFHARRFRALYRVWRKDSDAMLHATVSRILGDALTRRTARIGCQVLPRSYQRLSPLVGSA